MLEQKNVTVKAGSSFQTICPFPVGYIYQSYNSTSPANIYGGSWTPITGRFLYCNNGTSVGGSNWHKLSGEEIPGHHHSMAIKVSVEEAAGWGLARGGGFGDRVIVNQGAMRTSGVGSSQAHNNMPAYQTCYAWRRTA